MHRYDYNPVCCIIVSKFYHVKKMGKHESSGFDSSIMIRET